MKFRGNQIKNNNVEYVVIPRPNEDIVFKFLPVLNYDHFDKVCPLPKPPTIVFAEGGTTLDEDDKNYKKKLVEYAALKSAYIFLTSVRESEITWDTVNYDDPTTWVNYVTELKDSEFTDAEIAQMFNAISKVNSLDDSHLEVAKNRFLASLAVKETRPPQ